MIALATTMIPTATTPAITHSIMASTVSPVIFAAGVGQRGMLAPSPAFR
jgi:hypothetical protein